MSQTQIKLEQFAHPISPIATEEEKSKGLPRTEKGGSLTPAIYKSKSELPTVAELIKKLQEQIKK
jgi:hypothetical protein